MGHADSDYLSATYWQYKSYADPTTQAVDKHGRPCEGVIDTNNNTLMIEKAAMIARPYAPAVSGMFASMSYDDDTRTFVLKFLSRLPGFNPRGLPRPEDTTVIFFSSLTYHRWDRLQVEADPPYFFNVTVDTRARPMRVLVLRTNCCFPNGTLWQDYATVTVRDGDPGRSDGVSDV